MHPLKLFFLVHFFILFPGTALAYLDPASGNAIISFFVALFGSILYFFKSLFYKIFSKPTPVSSSTDLTIFKGESSLPILFSEGKSYWNTFKPIVEELIKEKINFRYVTLDIHDPGLAIDNEFMSSKRYSRNRMGFAKIERLLSPVMISTTPNIGCEGYPLNRPPGVKNLVHVFHAMVDVSCYRKGSLDFYDSVFMTGPHEEVSIRKVEKARAIKQKSLVVAGLPYLDELYRQKMEAVSKLKVQKASAQTVLIAPSWGPKGCFNEYGVEFVKSLAQSDFNIIIRLHPHSYIFEPDSVSLWKSQLSGLNTISWDENTFGTEAMLQADILVSDASSIRFDFAFLFEKPVITLPISQQSLSVFESDYLSETWADSMSNKIGVEVKADNLDSLNSIVKETILNFTPGRLRDLRNSYVANFGRSSEVIVKYIKKQTELLSMTATEQLLKSQLDDLKAEVESLKRQFSTGHPSEIENLSE